MSEGLIRAGLAELWVSMDGFDASCYEAIQRGGQYEALLKNLEAFNHARRGTPVRLGVTFVVSRSNLGQLERMNEFADRFAVDELNLSRMIPGEPMSQEELLYDREDIPAGKMRRYGLESGIGEENTCPFIIANSTFVRRDGCVVPCMQLLHSGYTWLFEERRHITSFSYGNVLDKSLEACWRSADYSAFRHRVDTFYFPFCRVCWGCEDRKKNLVDCILNESPTCGACLWATGKVFCP